jgi:hypothetical protein
MNKINMEQYEKMSKDELLEELRLELTSGRHDLMELRSAKEANTNLSKNNHELKITLKTILKTLNT